MLTPLLFVLVGFMAGRIYRQGKRSVSLPPKHIRSNWRISLEDTSIVVRTPYIGLYLADGGMDASTRCTFTGIRGVLARPGAIGEPSQVLWQIDRSRLVSYL